MNAKDLGHPLLRMQIRAELDIVTARQKTRRISELLGFDSQDQARLATAVSELARNVYQYASMGVIEFFFAESSPFQGLFVRVSDKGKGIANLSEIFGGSYVSKSGMGIGLSGSKKLMDHFEIESSPDSGTTVVIGKNLDRRAPRVTKEALSNLAEQLVARHGESPFEEVQRQNRDLLNALDELQASKAELSELNRELSETNRGVVALYAELDEKATSLQRANEVKTSFLSHMTHEFRTPLSSIISLTRLLMDRIDGDLTPEQERQVRYIRQSSEGLLDLVSDLLDLAKVEAGKIAINVNEFSMEELMGAMRGVFRPLLGSDSPVELSIDWSPGIKPLNTDQAKVSQILRNLVANAIKYTERGSIRVHAEPGPGDSIHFSVIDSGIGIDPDHFNAIFEDFSQVESRLQRKTKGTGLGLPLSRKLSRLLGGDLYVESSVGKGSTFHARIPRVYNGADEAVLIGDSSHESSSSLSKDARDANSTDDTCAFKVILIDDDEASRYVLKNLIRQEIKAEFIEAPNGKVGLERIKEAQPDVVFLDLAMPELNGFEVLKVAKSDAHLREIPIIVNTAMKLSDDDVRVLSQDASAVLSKDRTDYPSAVKELRSALARAGFDYGHR